MEKFNLADYSGEIRSIAEYAKVSATEAVQLFITNLTTMREFYPGAPLNYHSLGQQWNKLLSAEKVEQKELVTNLMRTAAQPMSKLPRGARSE